MRAYYASRVEVKRGATVARLVAARALDPLSGTTTTDTDIDAIASAFTFCKDPTWMDTLRLAKTELLEYKALKDLIPAAESRRDRKGRDTFDHSTWWAQHATRIPNISKLLRAVLCHVPSSCAAERVFSILNNSFGANQKSALADYKELSLQLQFNKRTRDA